MFPEFEKEPKSENRWENPLDKSPFVQNKKKAEISKKNAQLAIAMRRADYQRFFEMIGIPYDDECLKFAPSTQYSTVAYYFAEADGRVCFSVSLQVKSRHGYVVRIYVKRESGELLERRPSSSVGRSLFFPVDDVKEVEKQFFVFRELVERCLIEVMEY